MKGPVVELKPPYGNTGAQSTSESGLRPLVDWVQVTFKKANPDELIEDILMMKPEHFVELDSGKYGYKKSKKLGHIAVYYDGLTPDMGIHLEMSGQGCREYESYGIMDWSTLFRVMLNAEGDFTRLDIAIDDFKGYWKIKTIVRKAEREECVSRYRDAYEIKRIRLKDGKKVGHSVYYGSAHSRIRVRFYDKLLERMAEGDSADLEGLTVWNRTEIQSRNERAQAIAGLIADGKPVGLIASGVLRHYIRFVVKGKDSNKSRWKTCKFWDEFLQGVEPLRLATAKPEQSLEKKIAWIDQQVAPTLAAIIRAFDGDMQQIYTFIRHGMKRLKPHHEALIRQYKENETFIFNIPQDEAV